MNGAECWRMTRKCYDQTIRFPLWLPHKDLEDILASQNFQHKSKRNIENTIYENTTLKIQMYCSCMKKANK